MKTKSIVDECRKLSDKARAVIDSATLEQKPVVERYLSLYNTHMHHNIEKIKTMSGPFAIVGMSMGIRKRFENKFGTFNAQTTPIYAIQETSIHK